MQLQEGTSWKLENPPPQISTHIGTNYYIQIWKYHSKSWPELIGNTRKFLQIKIKIVEVLNGKRSNLDTVSTYWSPRKNPNFGKMHIVIGSWINDESKTILLWTQISYSLKVVRDSKKIKKCSDDQCEEKKIYKIDCATKSMYFKLVKYE